MRTSTLVASATLLSAAFIGVLLVPGVSPLAILLVSNGGQLLAAALASAGCAVGAQRCTGQRRRAWLWLSVGTGAWAAGQLVWSYYEVVLDREVPFPSLSDVGFLIFPLAAAVGLVIWLGTQGDQLVARTRDVLDGTIIAGSLLVLSWVTTLGSIVKQGDSSPSSLALSLAYPIGDLILATLALIALARGTGRERTTLGLLAVGLGGLAFADSLYVYLVSLGHYTSADLASSGWVIGFLFAGVSGLTVGRRTPHPLVEPAPAAGALPKPSKLRLSLPYVPLVAAGVVLCANLLTAPTTPVIELVLGIALVLLVLTRQFLSMADNLRLLAALGEARDQLEHQALHDSLTGLANRVLFADRLDRALLQPAANVSVLFCDLDDFKLVNDQLGHAAGDLLLQRVAERLLECVRITDTVARLGGDEFAILLEDATDSVQVADRVVARLNEPIDLDGSAVRTSISVGIAHHEATSVPVEVELRADVTRRTRVPSAESLSVQAERQATAALLLQHADTAMYAAKGAGKSRAVLAED
jgi:diguanylate cyclase